MSVPTIQEIRDNLEGYNITSSIISDAWITIKRDKSVVPFVNKFISSSLLTEEIVTEFYSGNGTQTLILNRRYVKEIVSIQLVNWINSLIFLSPSSVELISEEGILKVKSSAYSEYRTYSFFPRGENNIKITYKYGYNNVIPDDINYAIILLTNVHMLRHLEGSTGGGNLSTQGYSRDYGAKGKYTHYINRLSDEAINTLRYYTSSVVGA